MARMPVAGEVIDDVFRVESEIDSGNFGSVYKVHDMVEDRVLALKVLRPGTHDESELRRRFEREARLIYSLNHKHIVRVYYYGETNAGLPYMAMEYLEGTDLRTLIQHHGALNPALLRRITVETLSALEAAHNLGIVHRDLKPANIFLAKDGGKGHVKVLDFGFAKAIGDANPNADITNAGVLVGTPAYMSPELVHKKNIGPAADLYAMGLIMAEMVMGEKILQIEAVYDTILFQASPTNIKFPGEVVSSPFAEVIAKATQKKLDKRYKTAREMGADLGGLPSTDETTDPSMQTQTPVLRKLYITDASDEDTTVPRAMGLPSESELAALMAMGQKLAREDTGDTDEKTIEWGAMKDKIPDIRPQRANAPSPVLRASTDSPVLRPSTGRNEAVRHTPRAGLQRVTPSGSQRPQTGPQPRVTKEARPTTGRSRAVENRPSTGRSRAVPQDRPSTGRSRSIPDTRPVTSGTPAIDAKPPSRWNELILGLCLGALLLAIMLIAVYMWGTPKL